MFSLYTRSSWSAPVDGWMDKWMETRLAWLHISFRCYFFLQQLPRLLLPTTRSTGCNPPPPLPSLTAIFHHSPSIGFLVPQQATRRRRFLIDQSDDGPRPLYSGAIRDSDQSLMRCDLLESIGICRLLLADSRNGTGRIHGSQLNLTDLNFWKMTHSWIFSAVPGVGYSILCLSFISFELNYLNIIERLYVGN